MTCPGPENAARCEHRACRYGGCQGRMPRYAPRSAAIYDDSADATAHTASDIILPTDDDEWIDSGLVDASGTPLYRQRERRRIGFAV